mmetsp:Transcript_43010/g.103697  ORF Transcript_43010/g.103697 Transcript_43010/m.103697 type:complete len:278 (-) Transcript_43010:2611-3444(-)
MLDPGPPGGAGAAVIPRNEDVIRLALGDTCCNDAHSDFRHQLHTHIRSGVGVLQIEDQLGQILDGVNVVVRRRGDQPNSGGGLAGLGDVFQHLPPRQLAALTRLRPLSHLNLQLISIGQIIDGHSKPPRSHLLDRAPHGIPILQGHKPCWVLTTLTGVALRGHTVHPQGQCGVRLHTDGPVGHGSRAEALHDLTGGLHGVNRERLAAVLPGILEVQLASQGALAYEVVVQGAERCVGVPGVGARGLLQLGDEHGVIHVGLGVLVLSVVILTALRQGL